MKLGNLTNPVMASWLREQGFRLDAPPFLSGAIEARKLLERLPVKKEPLALLTQGGLGVFHAGRIKRNWVTELEYGVPFLSSTDILQADLSYLSLISKQVVTENPLLTIRKDWILITRSGSIGRMAYARPDMDGMACSEHVLRVAPDPDRILPGYLYAFLSSKFGVPLVVGGTYGAIIQHIEPHHIANLPVPRLGEAVETRAHELVQEAAEARTKASRLLRQASTNLLKYFALPPIQHSRSSISFSTFRVCASQLSRLDAAHHNPVCAQSAQCLASVLPPSTEKIGNIAKVFTPGIFKRIHVNDPMHGYAYFSGSELFQLDPSPRGYLSHNAPHIADYIVEQDWLLMQDAGQLGGLIGQVVRVTPQVHLGVVSNHLMRFVCNERPNAAYLFALLSSRYGYLSITRHAFGSSIPQLDPGHISQVAIPWPELKVWEELARPVLQAWDLQDRARVAEHEAVALLEPAIEEAA